MTAAEPKDQFDQYWRKFLRVLGAGMAATEFFIFRMEHPEVLLLAGPMMGVASLLKNGTE